MHAVGRYGFAAQAKALSVILCCEDSHLFAVFREVDNGCSGVRLDARVLEVIHDSHEPWQQARMFRLLKVGAQVRAHLAHRLACRPPHLWVLILQPLHPVQYFQSCLTHARWNLAEDPL